MPKGLFQVQILDRESGEERSMEVMASSEDEARRILVELGQIVGAARLLRVVDQDEPVSTAGSRPAPPPTPAREVPLAGGTSAKSKWKSPAAAAMLNFLFWGGGYLYAGRSWGMFILVPYVLISYVSCISMVDWSLNDLLVMTLLFLPIDAAFAIHAYAMIKEDQSKFG